jgi:CIC family chloride channel protein
MTRKRNFLSALLDRVAPPEGLILDILAVVVGGSTGFAAVYFIKLIAFIQNFFYSSPQNFLPDIGLFLYFLIPVMDIMQGVLVKEVMNRKPVVVSRYDSLECLEEKFKTTNFLGFPVFDKRNRLWGIVTLQDINRLLSHEKFLRVEDIAVTTLVTVYEDEPIWTAIQKMASRDLARLPVVHREKKHELLGLISRSEILRAYEVAIVRKQRGQMLDRNISVRQQKENEFMEFQLHYGDWSVGKPLKDLALPETVNVVSVKRGNEDIVPKGGTCFAIGDVITVYGKKRSMDKVKKVFAGSGRS